MHSYQSQKKSRTKKRALFFEPSEASVKTGTHPSFLRSLITELEPVRLAVFYIFLTSLAILVPQIAFPAFSQVFIDKVVVIQDMGWAPKILLGVLGMSLLAAFITMLQQFVMVRLSIRFALQSSSFLVWQILFLPYTYFQQMSPGELVNRLKINLKASHILTSSVSKVTINSILVLAYSLTIFAYNVLIGAVGLTVLVLHVWFSHYLYKSLENAYESIQRESEKAMDYASNTLRNIETIKSTAREMFFFTKWCGQYTRVINLNEKMAQKEILVNTIPIYFGFLVDVIILGIGTLEIMKGNLTFGMFFAIQILMKNLMGPLKILVSVGKDLQLLHSDAARVEEVLIHTSDRLNVSKESTKQEEGSDLETAFTRVQTIELKDISFGYSLSSKPLISNFNLRLTPGKRVALVGPSGSGKTTIAKILVGLLAPWEGEVLIDGKPVKEVPRNTVASCIAYVEQTSFLFEGSIKDNITLFDSTIGYEDIIQASKDACIYDYILSKKAGFDNWVDEKGLKISEGEKQRIEIARCLAKFPSIFILDEGTSSLDFETESKVIRNIKNRGCTCLIISYRLDTVRHCDEIIVLRDGEVIQKGTHEELIDITGMYKSLMLTESNYKEKF